MGVLRVEPDAKEAVAGLVERITFHSPETGFCVLRIKLVGNVIWSLSSALPPPYSPASTFMPAGIGTTTETTAYSLRRPSSR